MKRIIKKWQETNMTYRLLALLFSIILFVNTSNSPFQSAFYSNSESYSETAENVPVTLNYDTDKYYVYGYEPSVKVKLTSFNRVRLDSELNEDTRNFKVVADLTKLDTGTFEVKLKVEDIGSAVTASVEPKTLTVTIEKKVTKTMAVEPIVSSSAFEEGYKLDEVTANPAKVTITTGEGLLKQVDKVVATVSSDKAITEDFSENVSVAAVDASGQALSVVSDPPKVDVSVKVIAPKKEVELRAGQRGTPASGVSSYDLTLAKDSASISGPQSVINLIDSITVPVDVTGVLTETTKTVEIPTGKYSVEPATVRVTIKPVMEKETASSSEEDEEEQNSGNTSNSNSNTNSNTGNETNTGNQTEDKKPTESSEPTTESTAPSEATVDSSESKPGENAAGQ